MDGTKSDFRDRSARRAGGVGDSSDHESPRFETSAMAKFRTTQILAWFVIHATGGFRTTETLRGSTGAPQVDWEPQRRLRGSKWAPCDPFEPRNPCGVRKFGDTEPRNTAAPAVF